MCPDLPLRFSRLLQAIRLPITVGRCRHESQASLPVDPGKGSSRWRESTFSRFCYVPSSRADGGPAETTVAQSEMTGFMPLPATFTI